MQGPMLTSGQSPQALLHGCSNCFVVMDVGKRCVHVSAHRQRACDSQTPQVTRNTQARQLVYMT